MSLQLPLRDKQLADGGDSRSEAEPKMRPAWVRRWLPATAAFAAYLVFPAVVQGDFWLSMLCLSGIGAIGALGLNLLTGLSGQVSLGHAFFLGVGGYAVAALGAHAGLPMIVWLPAAGVVGGLAGALFGPVALRLQGTYLVIGTLGLVYLGMYIFQSVPAISGGLSGESVTVSASLGPLDFAALQLGSQRYSRNQGMFWLIWALVACAALLCRNLSNGRVGRALRSIRDYTNVAVATGVPVASYKVKCFVVSSALAGIAGGLYACYVQFLDPQQWNLGLSIEYITIIIIGGMGSVSGTIVGAVVVLAIPSLLQRYGGLLPFLSHGAGTAGLSVFIFNQIVYALLIIAFLLFEPGGINGLWNRFRPRGAGRVPARDASAIPTPKGTPRNLGVLPAVFRGRRHDKQH
jgi:branched-chain amino acid transport system permease protein